jgi:ubiquitin carboxyl-terminal hydrolase 34
MPPALLEVNISLTQLRTCLKDVPDNLIFHLKRFDFDLLEMRRAKINDYFSFPEQIDISAYNIDHLSKPSKPRNEDLFELVGVLIHQGTSENGHYYSYIRERPCPSGGMTDWVEFNDRDVDKFDHRTIPSNAYGGPFEDQFHGQQKPFSAYMLFYQRKVSINKDHDEYIRSPNCGNVKVPVPPALEAEIDRDNQLFIREYCLHDPNHSKFVRQILATLRTVNNGTCSEDHEQEKQALHVALEHLCQTVARQKNPEHFEELIIQLRKTVLSCPGCCQAALNWFATHDSAVSGLLLRCPHPKIRSQARAFLVDGLRALRQQDSAAYLGTNNTDTDAENGQHSPSPSPSQGILIDVVRRLRLVGDELWMSSRGWDDYFLTLCQIGRIGLVEIAVLLNYEFLELCLKMLSMHGREQFRNAMPDLWRLVEKKKNIFNRLIELVYVITQHMSIELQPVGSTASGLDRMQFYDRIHSKFPLTQLELECLYIWDDNNRAMAVMDKMIETFDPAKTDIFYPGEFLKWLLESQDRRFHVRISKTVYEGISEISPPFSEPYVRAAQPYCEACYDPELVGRVVDAVAKSGTNLTNLSGEVYLDFLNALPNLQNPALFDLQGPNVFYLLALRAARFCAIPLLLYEDETVRKSTESHLDYLLHHFEPEDAVDPETVRRRDVTIRNLADKMSKKIVLEHSQGSSRAYMQPLINTCTVLMDLVQARILSDDEDLPKYQNDENLVAYWDTEVVPRLQAWRTELSTPISTAGRLALNSDPDPVGTPTDSDSENFEQSDYGSESDDCVEVEQ